ncbi:uncharacterized protein [Danio rerio]|uniref:Uncharacterized protein n=1 Tax=Danio rerio TaxID=7955 RepID=A0ACD6B5V9_DANRE
MKNMSSDEDVPAASKPSHLIGKKENIIKARRVVKSIGGRDVLVIYHQGHFYAIDARCYHSGGPLQEGDIEDFDGRTCIVCPWHKYKITLAEGEGLYQAVDPTVKPLKPTWCSKGMDTVSMILRLIITLYVTCSLEMQSLSHAQTVNQEMLGLNTWRAMLPTYMDEKANNFNQGQANGKSFKYLISIKINASREMIQDRLRTLLQGRSFSYGIGQNVTITNVNPNKTQPLKLFKYKTDLKITASRETVIDQMRDMIREQKFPMCIKKGMEISSASITTVCLSNLSKTECKCENQYIWSSEQCSIHGVCGSIQNNTCGCITSLPTDGTFCHLAPARLKSFRYTIDININASREAVINQMKVMIREQNFMCIKKGVKISSANITTVCLSNISNTECRCENQYIWPSEQCSKHGVCGLSQNNTCGCITSLPTDGMFCWRSTAPLKPFKFSIDIKINVSREAVIERLKAIIKKQKFPMCIKKGMEISSGNITTVCLSNLNKSECSCENQYIWSSDQCSKHGVCGSSQNNTCGCINSLPTDGSFCRPPKAPLKLFRYTIDMKINASREAVIDHLRSVIRTQKFPMCIRKEMKISSANITTVCLSSLNKSECSCENQYIWFSEQCSNHGNRTCGCITSPLTDGSFCQPQPAKLKSFRYTIDLKINSSREAVITHFRALINRQKFPMCIRKGMKISSTNITTVCLSNSSKTECSCENQYIWSSEQCSKHGVCDLSQNNTCGCITSLPTDGMFCNVPPAQLKSFRYTINMKLNASTKAVINQLKAMIREQKFRKCIKKGVKISSSNITTVCLSNSSRTECSCENQYSWSSDQCSKYGVCGPSQNNTCGCINSLPTNGMFCRPPTAPLKSFRYTIDMKVNASKKSVIKRLKAIISGQKFSLCFKKGMSISTANITTVCFSNSSQTKCKCENQYIWSSEQCSKHGICDPSQNNTCGCITSLPTDGIFCRPQPARLQSFRYTIDMKINASREAVIDSLRTLTHGQTFSKCVKKEIKIPSTKITTVCLSSLNKTECTCENQYIWSSEQCSKQGVCGPSQNITCGCITSLPTDGSFCRPPSAYMKSFRYTIDIKVNASNKAVIDRLRAMISGQKFPMCVKKGMKISSTNITTVCVSNMSETECSCENQYIWSSEQCSKHGACGSSQNNKCGCINSLPTDGTNCHPPPTPLKSFRYTIDIKVNASNKAVINRLRAMISEQKFPMCVKKGMKISSTNITTVCFLNSSKTECRCENQYIWSSEQCSKHGVCGPNQNNTCGCITSLPTDGTTCHPAPAPLKAFRYTIDIKVNASEKAVINRLKAIICGQKLPVCVKKGMKISSTNTTTVCLSNSSMTQNNTCRCITSIPTNGIFCQPPRAQLKSFRYTIDIKINASRGFGVDCLKVLINGQKFPMCVRKGMKISSANITTVCLSSLNKTECRCENQYIWSSDQCSKYGVCGSIQNNTCGCITSLPTDRSFCHPAPAPPLRLFRYTIDIKINASRDVVIDRLRTLIHGPIFPICVKKEMKISSTNVTTVCFSNSSQTKCICENQYIWSSEQCSKHRVCGSGQNNTCGCITSLPIDGPFCRPPRAQLKSFRYTIDIKINSSREVVIDHLRALVFGRKFPVCVSEGMKISSINITTAPLKSFRYTIDIKVNASNKAVINCLRAIISEQKFPMCVKKGMKISSTNITTVCFSNSSHTQCKCENQYIWSSEQCSKHGFCGSSQNNTCGCITSLPTDGSFCRPPPAAPLRLFRYTIDIKINASRDVVIDHLRALIHGSNFPVCVKKEMKISSANITTVCFLNLSKTECSCENQYIWSSEQCSKYGVCGPGQNNTCGCITSLPTNGSFCQPPPAQLKSFRYTIDIKVNASKDVVMDRIRALSNGQQFPMCVNNGMKLLSANITTVCLSSLNKTECSCENQYIWSSEQCSKHGIGGPNQNNTCGCITSLPADGTTCHPAPAPLKSFRYTIDIKVNASEKAVIDRLRAMIIGQKFPMCIKKGMKISSTNITTVCFSNSSQTECSCENQYIWSSEQCSKHGVCGSIQNNTCGCITSLPTNVSFCQPRPAQQKSFSYTIDIKINASRDVVIDQLRALIQEKNFPMCIKKGVNISSANITTVCFSNSSKTECSCENQYIWSSEQCSKHGYCGLNQNHTCGCITSLPTDGSFCRPLRAQLKLFRYTIDIKINVSKEVVIDRLRTLIHRQKFPTCAREGMKISSVNITTVCLSSLNKTKCSCENQYIWSSEQCSKHGVCGTDQNNTCGCITSLPTDGSFCRPPSAYMKSFRYTIDIKVNASNKAVIDRLRAMISGPKFPMCVKKGMKISSTNITTVCLSNMSKTECSCENQYIWSSDQCSKYAFCGSSQNTRCGCITSLPTDGSFCRPQPAYLKSFRYTIEIKANTLRKAVIDQLKAMINGQKFPICVKKDMKISSANITTVCLSNSSKTECRCENQYIWSSEQCSKHGVCGPNQNNTCGCITSLPTDGTTCHPAPAPLKSFRYTIDIKVNASEKAVIDRLRAMISGQKLPMCIKKGMKISSTNITTVCLSSPSKTECSCENQYIWSSEQCSKHGVCDYSQNNTCGCITSLPTDRSFCRPPPAYMKSFRYTIYIKVNASNKAVIDRLRAMISGPKFPMCVKKGIKISSTNITTVCLSNMSKTECSCENQYIWSSDQCFKYAVCGSSQNTRCGCITSLFSTDGSFCRPQPAYLKSFRYTIEIKANTLRKAVIDQLKAMINGQKSPICVKKDMKISSANITTVCLSNSSKTECRCENQYIWSSEQCSKHGVCGPIQNNTCGCITSLPTDGTTCHPAPAPLKSFRYTIDIKVNASEKAVIDRLRAMISGQKLPMCIKKGMKISSTNITTVCLSSASKTECSCENQYIWSSEQCSKHGVCDYSQNNTCGCITSLPTDRSFCRPPRAQRKSFRYTIDIKMNASRDVVIDHLRALVHGQKIPVCVREHMKISSANITTVCLSSASRTECSCENQYIWSSEQSSKYVVCGLSQNNTCGCITSLPTDGSFCRPQPAYLKSFRYTIDIKVNASRKAVIDRLKAMINGQKFPICAEKGMKISSANITTGERIMSRVNYFYMFLSPGLLSICVNTQFST